MALKYSSVIMCLASTIAVSSPALLAGCGDGVFTMVRGGPGTPDDGASSRDASADGSTSMARDAQQLDDAGLPFVSGQVTSASGGCVSMSRVTVCIPPGAVYQRATMSLHAFKNENIEAASESGSPGMFVFRVDLESRFFKMGNEHFPCVTIDYDGLDTTNVVPAQYFDRQGSRGWEPMLPFNCAPLANSVVGAISEGNGRLASGVIITAAQNCNSGSDCKTNYCSAKVCQ